MRHEPTDLELYNALREYERLQQDCGILFYEPHPKQDAFHRAGEFMLRYVRTGNRFGKSELGACEDIAWALGERPWYPEGDPARTAGIPQKSNKILVIVQDWDKAHEIFTNPSPGQNQGKIFKYLPKTALAEQPRRSKNGVISEVKIKSIHGGISVIYFDTVKSFLANPMSQESSDWDAIHGDEPFPKAMWVANSRGLVDRAGKAWFTCTPLTEGWINDMFVPRTRYRLSVDNKPIIGNDGLSWMITGSIYDNPHIKKEGIAMFVKSLTPSQKQCRLHGIPLALEGIVYKNFDRTKHCFSKPPNGWKAMDRPPEHYTIRFAVDTHPEQPHAVLFAATAPNGQVFFFDELFEKVSIGALCERINDRLVGYNPFLQLLEPAAFKESPVDDRSFADVFYENGLFMTEAPKDLSRGILEVELALDRTIMKSDGDKVPWLNFGEHLYTTLFEFDHYEWDPKKPNKPKDKDDHMMENLYRLVISDLSYVDQEEKHIVVPSGSTGIGVLDPLRTKRIR